MYSFILALFLSLFGSHQGGPGTTHDNCAQVTTLDDTGGETGHIPPKPPTSPTQP